MQLDDIFIDDLKNMSKEISELKQRYAKFSIEVKPVQTCHSVWSLSQGIRLKMWIYMLENMKQRIWQHFI